MPMKYYRLFDLLARRDMKKTDLVNKKIISSPTLAKLSKGETVTTEVLSNICKALNCQPGDIMEYVPESNKLQTLKQLAMGSYPSSGTNAETPRIQDFMPKETMTLKEHSMINKQNISPLMKKFPGIFDEIDDFSD